jgi:hypothetical protein
VPGSVSTQPIVPEQDPIPRDSVTEYELSAIATGTGASDRGLHADALQDTLLQPEPQIAGSLLYLIYYIFPCIMEIIYQRGLR